MFRWLSKFWRRPPPRAGRTYVRARYDAAQTTDENRRHWAGADSSSARVANRSAVRRELRNRARYEVRNNCYAKGIVQTLANYLIGTGPRLQVLLPDRTLSRRIERAFGRWATEVRLAEKLRVMRTARAQDGEAFAMLATYPERQVQLDILLIEADQIDTPLALANDPHIIDGIVFDSHGHPKEYILLKHHPGDGASFGSQEYTRVRASQFLHWFKIERPGQIRGVPDLAPALPLFAELRRYTQAVISAAETAACFAGILYTDSPPGGETEPAVPFEPIELERRALLTVPGGWRMEQMRAEHPSTTYGDFKREILNEIARCFDMPYNIAAGNSSQYNYASGRLDHQVFFKSLRVERDHLATVVLDPVLRAWLDEVSLVYDWIPSEVHADDDWIHQWVWDAYEHVDPSKEADAQARRLESHTTTLAAECAFAGLDWEDTLRQRAKEIALMRELGLLPSAPAPPPKTTEEEEDSYAFADAGIT